MKKYLTHCPLMTLIGLLITAGLGMTQNSVINVDEAANMNNLNYLRIK